MIIPMRMTRADATRSRKAEEPVKRLEGQIHSNKWQIVSNFGAAVSKLKTMSLAQLELKHMEEIQGALMRLIEGGSGTSPSDQVESSRGDGLLARPRVAEHLRGNGNGGGENFHPELQFPTYSGSEPRAWIRRCEWYFNDYRITYPIKSLRWPPCI